MIFDYKIGYVFASRSRSSKFFFTLENIKVMSASNNYFVWAKLDTDDITMNNPEVIERIKKEYPEVTVKWGTSKNKIHAINRDLEDLPLCDIIINQSDDQVYLVHGFDNEIRAAIFINAPDLDCFLHYPDGSQKRTCTLSIMGIKYFQRTGYIYHEDFISVYCDNFETIKAQKLGKYMFIDKNIFIHLHPVFRKAAWDAQYRASESPENYAKDKKTLDRLMKEYNYL